MSLYRQAGGRSPKTLVATLSIGVLVGLAAGYLLGRGSVESPTAGEAIADARARLQPAVAGLELVPIEYEGAVSDGRVEAPTEYQAVRGAVARATESLADAEEDMRAIDAAGYVTAERSIARLSRAIESVAATAEVSSLAERARLRVTALATGSG